MYSKQHGEIYQLFTGGLRFIDSLNFLQASLDSLVKNTPHEKFKYTLKLGKNKLQKMLILKKGVYPYKHMDGWNRFSETKLPDQENFHSALNDQHIADEEYEHALKVWTVFECKHLGDYHDLCLKTDASLLADVFENFRSICLEKYGLDPAHYFTSPGYHGMRC